MNEKAAAKQSCPPGRNGKGAPMRRKRRKRLTSRNPKGFPR